jgi:predicted 3-demethylubiquinone-9 3-methyltransferase (glyoxalase superfamily)
MQKITPFLWFDNNAEEAMNFYTSLFKNSKVKDISRYTEVGPGQAGSVMTATFELEGEEFMVINGGPKYTFTPAVSFFVKCEDQKEIDHLWDSFAKEGEPLMCGWIKDKFGLCWQIIPKNLGEMLHANKKGTATKVMNALLQMRKLDVAKLEDAYNS